LAIGIAIICGYTSGTDGFVNARGSEVAFRPLLPPSFPPDSSSFPEELDPFPSMFCPEDELGMGEGVSEDLLLVSAVFCAFLDARELFFVLFSSFAWSFGASSEELDERSFRRAREVEKFRE
jgi:hypothetical protein